MQDATLSNAIARSAAPEAIAISLGAIPGALSRYYLTEWSKKAVGRNFPYGTFIINISGCVAMGFFFTLFKDIKIFRSEFDLLVRTGFLGAYTTFSTYGFDTLTLWRDSKVRATIFYWLGSAVFGIVGIQIGVMLARQFGV